MSKLSDRMGFGPTLNALVCIVLFVTALVKDDLYVAAFAWLIWGVLITIVRGVDVIGERIDKVQ